MQAQVDAKRGYGNQQAERDSALPGRIEGIRLTEVRTVRRPKWDHDQKRQSPERGEFPFSFEFQVSDSKFRARRNLARDLSCGEPASGFQVGGQEL